MMRFLVATTLFGLVAANSAQAAVITYTDRAAFLAAVPGATTEDFDSFGAGAVITTQVSGVTVSTDGENSSTQAEVGTVGALPFPMTSATSSGSNFLSSEMSAPTFATAGLSFMFASPQSAIGFFVVDGSPLGGFRLDLYSGALNVGGFSFPMQPGPYSFVGLVSTVAFDRADVDALFPGDSWGLDDLTTAAVAPAPVPAPGASSLLLVGLAGLGLRRRRT